MENIALTIGKYTVEVFNTNSVLLMVNIPEKKIEEIASVVLDFEKPRTDYEIAVEMVLFSKWFWQGIFWPLLKKKVESSINGVFGMSFSAAKQAKVFQLFAVSPKKLFSKKMKKLKRKFEEVEKEKETETKKQEEEEEKTSKKRKICIIC